MRNPVSTYRVQLSPDFTFEDLEEILDYIEELGISTIYSAPFFQARKGSSHGYDVVDPFRINKEIGRLETLKRISQRLGQKKMTWLQDIVPNHMAFDKDNIWLKDVLELGPESKYYNFFDIDWNYKNWQKLMAPFLGAPLDKVLEAGQLQIKREIEGFSFNYFEHKYPAAARSYSEILSGGGLGEWENKFREFSGEKEDWQELKEFFSREVEKDDALRQRLDKRLEEVNSSKSELNQILESQYFLPAHWKRTEQEINYRRFFTINDLMCLKMESREVFESYHRFIFQLCEQNIIHGLRIDHIDGLFDPKKYLEDLRQNLGEDFYIIVEKILEWEEKLPGDWPVQGTSGYGFLALANQLLTRNRGRENFSEAYKNINPENADYEDLVYRQKLFILKERMGGEYNNLWDLACEKDLLAEKNSQMKEALGAFLAAFPVYRIYPEEIPLKNRQKKIIQTAYEKALAHYSFLEDELKELKKLFLGEAQKAGKDMLFFLQRCQQFTGPLAAKGVEDTSFYIYNLLISHNEVGDSPENFGLSVKSFHNKMKKRARNFPLSINATATHDTKRGEDARMRINVLSELEEEWLTNYENWKSRSAALKKGTGPDSNEEYFIYQMLLGAWPYEGEPDQEFFKRSRNYLMKVLREAKINSSWAAPDEEYEQSVFDFLQALLNDQDFKTSFLPFQKKISSYGAIKSLSQLLLKVASPGVPDIYQGTELWDLSYVDPDNRRAVNYRKRREFLGEMKAFFSGSNNDDLRGLKKGYSSGKIKMYCLYKALNLRREFPEVFESGDYMPLEVKENFSERIVCFCRKKGDRYVLVVVPVLVSQLFDEDLELKKNLAGEKLLNLPADFPGQWKNVLTGSDLSTENEIELRDLFQELPIALLTNSI